MFNENEKKKIVHQRIAYQKSLSEVARMFGTSRIQIRKIEAMIEYSSTSIAFNRHSSIFMGHALNC